MVHSAQIMVFMSLPTFLILVPIFSAPPATPLLKFGRSNMLDYLYPLIYDPPGCKVSPGQGPPHY